ncbi:MAG TPA: DUF1127 domain-containing protein [Xanthobacteraceae bacterium]|nr:DUF1127 domain-containing protein [Xanthobacteraceae bacterium]
MTSSTETLKTTSGPVRKTVALARGAFARIRNLGSAIRHRRDVELLARFDDRMLADVGLTRSDVRYALSEPFWRDPGRVLMCRAGERGPERRGGGDPLPDRIGRAPSIVPENAGLKLARC